MDERLKRLLNFAVQGDVDALFSIVAEDPLVLERIDEMSFVTTPVHAAVSGGKIHFVKEILNLKPSLVGRRDHLGRGLLHLALEGKHLQEGLSPRDSELVEKYQELVTFLIKIHPEVVRVKAKGMVTPLHYAAELDDETNLAEFLYVCPSSIEDLTVKSETAIHVAIKNRSFKAFKVLLGWLRHFDKEKILKWENEEGHNALHTAISENQPEPEVVMLLIKCMNVNRKNGKGLTALDIFYDLQPSLNSEVKQILLGAKAKRASQLNPGPNIKTRLFLNLLGAKNYSLVDYLCGELASAEVLIRKMGLADRIISKIPLEVQNVVLVVAILIATATYQATLSPPGGFWQDDGGPAKNNTAVIKTSPFSFSSNIFLNPQFYRGQSQEVAGHMIQGSTCHLYFLIFNTVAFSTSVSTIIIVTSGLCFSKIIGISTTLIVLAYTFAVTETSPYLVDSVLWYFFYILVSLIRGAAYYIPFLLYLRRWMLKFYGPKKLSLGSLEQPKI